MTATATNQTLASEADLYTTVDLEYRQGTDDRGRAYLLHHVEFAKVTATGEILRATVRHRIAGAADDAVVDLLNRNREWTRIATIDHGVWSKYQPSPLGRGATEETNRANIASVARELLTKASKIMAAAG